MLRRFSIASGFAVVKGFLNPGELLKAALSGLGASTLTALAISILSALSDHAAAILPNPLVASLFAFILTQAVDQLRRLGHGATPNPAGVIPLAPEPPAPGGSASAGPFYRTLGPALAALVLFAAACHADEPAFAGWLNAERRGRGLGAVAVDPALTVAAAANNAAQRSRGMGHHVMGHARRQNAGAGPEPAVWGAWARSPAHASALFDPSVTAIGYAFDGQYTTYSGR